MRPLLLLLTGVRFRILLVLAAPLVALVVVQVVATSSLGNVERQLGALTDLSIPEMAYSYDIELASREMLMKTQRALLDFNPESRQVSIDAARNATNHFNEAFDSLEALDLSDRSASMLPAIREAGDGLIAVLTPVWDLLAANTMIGNEDAQGALESDVPARFTALEDSLSGLVDLRDEEMDHAAAAASASLSGFARLSQIATVGALVISGGLGLFMAGRISGRINWLSRRVRQIADGHGALEERRIEWQDNTELGALAESFNMFSDTVAEIVTRFDEAAQEVSRVGNDLAAASTQMTASLGEQAEQVRDISDSTESMATDADAAAIAAEQASAASVHAKEAANSGNETLRRLIQEMEFTRTAVGEGADSVTELGSRSQEIGEIIQVIDDIAEQTNLLALNAAIEAARAGEHGRGFAVVADEVRKLAERTQQATEKVSATVREIQTGTETAVSLMSKGSGLVESGAGLTREASDHIERIVGEVQQSAERIGLVTTALEQNRSLSAAIKDRTGTISSAAMQQAEVSEETSRFAMTLSGKAGDLRRIIDDFRADRSGA